LTNSRFSDKTAIKQTGGNANVCLRNTFNKGVAMVFTPEFDEVKEMSRAIEEILKILRIQNTLLCQLLVQSAKTSSDLNELASRPEREKLNQEL
jgi:hypothetical protein